MLKKELHEIAYEAALMLGVMAGVWLLIQALSFLFDWSMPFSPLLLFIIQWGLLIFSLVSGLSLFARERQQRGIEYMLTLPYSRYRLLAIKVLPRLAALIVFFLVYIAIASLLSGPDAPATYFPLPHGMFLYAILSLFLIGVSLSAFQENFILMALVALFISFLYFFWLFGFFKLSLWKLFDRYLDLTGIQVVIIGFVGVLLPLVLAFGLSFRRFDLRLSQGFGRSFKKYLALFLVIGLVVSAIFAISISESYGEWYSLTAENRLVVEQARSLTINDGEQSHRFERSWYSSWLLEDSRFLYFNGYSKSKRSLFRLDKKTFQEEFICDLSGVKNSLHVFRKFKDNLGFIENWTSGDFTNQYTLYIIDLEKKAVKTVPLTGKLPARYYKPRLFGADEIDGRRFWLVQSTKVRLFPLIRVWEDGKVEELGSSRLQPAYIGRKLITYNQEAMVFSRLTGQGVEVIREVPEGKQVQILPTSIHRLYLDELPVKEIYGTIKKNLDEQSIVRIDLENYTISPVGDWNGHCFYSAPNTYWLIKTENGNDGNFYLTRLGLLENRKITVLKEFSLQDRVERHELSVSGIVLKENGRLKVYRLPDLEELHFKDLN